MSHVPARLRRLVVIRARGKCEYCGLAQAGQEAAFHVDHVVPSSKQGSTILSNLALACVSCSSALDPDTGRRVLLFNPRGQAWIRHFCWNGIQVVGTTATGRATISALEMNRP